MKGQFVMTKKDTATLDQILEARDQTLMVSELARLMGVHSDTIRRWERKGHLKSQRHPVNNYRMFKVNDLKGNLGNGENK